MARIHQWVGAGMRAMALAAALSGGFAGNALAGAGSDLLMNKNELIAAIEDKDRNAFSLAVVQDIRATIRDTEGVPAIIIAVETKDPFFVKGLLKHGARPDDTPRRGDDRTALTRAAEQGNVRMVRALLDAGADVDQTGTRSESALIKAANLGHHKVVGILIKAGADLTSTDITGRTAMEVAQRAGHMRIVDQLRAAGAEY